MDGKPVDFEALAAILDEMEALLDHPATVPLHDPLYALLAGERDREALAAARRAVRPVLARWPDHPLAGRVRAALGLEAAPAPDLAEVLARHGAGGEDDPVAEVERRLAEADRREAILRERVRVLEAELAGALRLSNGLAAAGALVAVFAVVGWLVALGLIPVSWIEPPAPEPADAPAADAPER